LEIKLLYEWTIITQVDTYDWNFFERKSINNTFSLARGKILVNCKGQIVPCFINKVLLEHGLDPSFTCCNACIWNRVTDLSCVNRDCIVYSVKMFTLWSFTQKVCCSLITNLVQLKCLHSFYSSLYSTVLVYVHPACRLYLPSGSRKKVPSSGLIHETPLVHKIQPQLLQSLLPPNLSTSPHNVMLCLTQKTFNTWNGSKEQPGSWHVSKQINWTAELFVSVLLLPLGLKSLTHNP
jgi:hypothetical protein